MATLASFYLQILKSSVVSLVSKVYEIIVEISWYLREPKEEGRLFRFLHFAKQKIYLHYVQASEHLF